ncbi:transposable element tc3 transposase-like protein [Holotrichia oblita]|uniref:Transposable element tc3 transposase-like protein n=1 Tax=Holotrichia oblita TaxID=644536 RepID=A0ACB9T818_HOLOL|nr:transposable element tc3 transposase-like protein [Holotrichia oblita]
MSDLNDISEEFEDSDNGRTNNPQTGLEIRKGKKRQRKVILWIRNQRKRLRNSGKSYVNSAGKKIGKKTQGPPCLCKLKCYEKFSDKDLHIIFEQFYAMGDRNIQDAYLSGLIRELEHKIFIIQCYYRTGQKLENGEWVYSINRCIEEFQQQFPNLPVTYAQLLKQIQACVIKFGEIGAVTRKPGGGAPKKRTANLIEDVQQRMEHSPKKSVATLSQQVGLSVGTCHTILKKDLKLFPYKIQAVSELKEIDFECRIAQVTA